MSLLHQWGKPSGAKSKFALFTLHAITVFGNRKADIWAFSDMSYVETSVLCLKVPVGSFPSTSDLERCIQEPNLCLGVEKALGKLAINIIAITHKSWIEPPVPSRLAESKLKWL